MFLFLTDKSYISTEDIISIHASSSAAMKRIITAAKRMEKLVDTTGTKVTRSVILMKNGFVYTSSVTPETLIKRLSAPEANTEEMENIQNNSSKAKKNNKNYYKQRGDTYDRKKKIT